MTPILRAQSDERLVELVRAGSDRAFETIVVRYRRALLRYCSNIVPGDRAEDAVQQTFLRAYDALRASDGEMQLRPWLYRIAHNQSLNALRDRSLGHEELDESIDGVRRPDQALEGKERLRDVLGAVSALPVRQRDAIVLRELEGRSYDEIASEMGVTGGAVRQLLNRARGTLRAGVTAVTPFALLTRMPAASEGTEILSGTVAAKAAATVLVTGAVVGGVATSPDSGTSDGRADPRPREERVQPGARSSDPSPAPASSVSATGDDSAGEDNEGGRGGGRGRGRGGDDEDATDVDEDRSGPRGGETETEEPEEPEIDNSGPGSSSSGTGSSGSSGSGHSGSGSSGSGSSGSGSSGSGSESSNSGPGSGDEEEPDA